MQTTDFMIRFGRRISVTALSAALLAGLTLTPAYADKALDTVLNNGTLRIETLGSLPPFTEITPSGKMQGYEIDIGKALAHALGVKAKFSVTDSAGRVAALRTGKADVTIADFTRTVKRSTVIAFSSPYLVTYQEAMLKADSPVKSATELNNPKYRIGFNRGGVGQQTVQKWFPKAQKFPFSENADALNALQSGQVDAIVEDAYYNAQQVKAGKGRLRQLPDKLARLEIAIGMPAGNPDFLRVVNLWIEQFNASGENDKVFKKWFGVDRMQ